MRPIALTFQFALLAAALDACAQGSFVYDQQSATQPIIMSAAPIQQDQPMGQSFTPALGAVGFVQFEFSDPLVTDALGATVHVNLWSGSISNGTLLASTAPVSMPNGFQFAVTNFFFSTAIQVTPGTTYFLQPVVQSGDNRWGIAVGDLNYSGGTAYFLGAPDPSAGDFWFREGVLTPEPSSFALALLGATLISLRRLGQRRRDQARLAPSHGQDRQQARGP